MPPRRQALHLEDNGDRISEDSYVLVEKLGLLFYLRRYGEVSAISGVPQLTRSKGTLRNILWTIVILATTGVLVWQTCKAISKYFEFGVTTSVSRVTNFSLNFPAVTFCNENPVDYLKVQSVSPELFQILKSWEIPSLRDNSISGTVNKGRLKEIPNINKMGSRNSDANYQKQLTLQSKLAALTPEQRRYLGSSIEDMLLSCYFNNFECTSREFAYFYNAQYGNCFTFNLMNNTDVLKSLEIGPQNGLRLMLFINSSSYVPTTLNSGVRILIHHHQVYPFPEDSGIEAAPGMLTSVGFGLSISSIQSPPYDQCVKLTPKEYRGLSAYVDLLPNITYSKEGCMKTCLQKYALLICKCYHPFIPFSSNMSAYENISTTAMRICDIMDNSHDYTCYENIKLSIMNNSLDCKNCTPPCKEYSYIKTISHCNWPSDIAQPIVINELNKFGPMVVMKNKNNNSLVQVLKNQILSVEIYYESLTYLQISQEIAYDLSSLISDLGGQVGLWLGLSVAALFEILELIYDLSRIGFHVIYIKFFRNQRKSNTVRKASFPAERF